MYIALVIIVLFFVVGFFWGKHSIQKDVERIDREDKSMDDFKKKVKL